jgi:hypothetical protein
MFSPQFDPNVGRAGTGRPTLEVLEDRTCPSSVSLSGHTLLINGNNSDNFIVIRDQGNGNVSASVVNGNGAKSVLNAKGVNLIQVHSGNGDDKIDYALTGPLTHPEQIALQLGQGDNQTKLNFQKGAIKSHLTVSVKTGDGDNQVDAIFGAITGGKVDLKTYLGDGFNQFRVKLLGDVTANANVSLYGNAGTGFSGLSFDETGTIAAGSKVAVNFQGGPSSDTFHENFRGRLDGLLVLRVNGGKSGDWIASDVALAAGSKGSLDAQFNGGAGDDLFVIHVRDQSGKMHSVKVLANGGAGSNQGSVTHNVGVSHLTLA